jgi:hypothetical protein
MAKGGKTGGRKAGTPNKLNAAAKEAIAAAAAALGGSERMVVWAREDPINERAFWTQIYPKLLPHDVALSGGLTIIVDPPP